MKHPELVIAGLCVGLAAGCAPGTGPPPAPDIKQTLHPTEAALPSPEWTLPALPELNAPARPHSVPTILPKPTAENTPTPEAAIALPKHTLLLEIKEPDGTISITALLPDGRRMPAPRDVFLRHKREPGEGPDKTWRAVVAQTTDSKGRPKSEVRIVFPGAPGGTAGYSDMFTTFADSPIAVSSFFDSASYIAVIQESGGKRQIKIVEGPYASNHMAIVADLPPWVKTVRSMSFAGEWLYVYAGTDGGKTLLFVLNTPVYHALSEEEVKNCPWAEHTLSECLSRKNKAFADKRTLVAVAGLPEGTVMQMTEVAAPN